MLVVGCGNMGASHARAYHKLDGFEISGIVALNEASCRQLADELSVSACFNNVDEALNKTKPDAVAVCSYPDTHHEFIIKSLQAGAHVFAEKPLATNVAPDESARAIGFTAISRTPEGVDLD